MKVADQQNAVFNRTERIDIPDSFIDRDIEPGCIRLKRLRHGEWSSLIDPQHLVESVLHVDVLSLLLWKRSTVLDPNVCFEPAWGGCPMEVPSELTSNDYRVRMQITIAFPKGHADAGRIVARSSEIVVQQGPDQSGGTGGSLLPVSPATDDIPELSRLAISENGGPVLCVNAAIAGISWKDLASDPKFKLAIFPDCVKEVLRYLVFNPGCRSTWGASWLDLDGIRGRDIPEIDVLNPQEAWKDICDYVDAACEGFMEQLQLGNRLSEVLSRKGAEQ